MAVFSLLRAAHRLFSSATVISNLERLIGIREQKYSQVDTFGILLTLDPAYLDAFRIATCFENLLKAELLDFGYVVHMIDPKAHGCRFRQLAELQKKAPVRATCIRQIEGHSWRRNGEFAIASLKPVTIGLPLLLDQKTAYYRSLRLSQRLVEALQRTRKERNAIHFIARDARTINDRVIEDYIDLREAVNRRLLPRYERIRARYKHIADNTYWNLAAIS